MDIVKARKQGNSLMVTLASKFGFTEGQEFYIFKEDDGSISLIPKINDYFKNVKQGEFYDENLNELATTYVPRGAEIDE